MSRGDADGTLFPRAQSAVRNKPSGESSQCIDAEEEQRVLAAPCLESQDGCCELGSGFEAEPLIPPSFRYQSSAH